MQDMTFSGALIHLKAGSCLTRTGWNARGQKVQMQLPDAHSKMGVPYLYLTNAQGKNVPWVPSQGDLFAEDWQVVPK